MSERGEIMKLSDDLRRSVLQAAIQGKLTQQLQEDGNVKNLLYHIRQEKQKLIKEGKIKKDKPLPAIDDSEKPFEIPDNWAWVRIGDYFNVIMGQSPKGKFINDSNGIEFHQGKIFFRERIIEDSKIKTSVASKIAPADSVLLCVRAPVGKVNITDREICIGRGLAAIKCCANTPTLFLYFLLKTLEETFNSKATGTTFKAITLETVNNQVVPLPPLAEQERIVERLNELLPLCEAMKGE